MLEVTTMVTAHTAPLSDYSKTPPQTSSYAPQSLNEKIRLIKNALMGLSLLMKKHIYCLLNRIMLSQ